MIGRYNQVVVHMNQDFGVARDAGHNQFYRLGKKAKQPRRRTASKGQNSVEITIFFQLVARQPPIGRANKCESTITFHIKLGHKSIFFRFTSNRTVSSTLHSFREKLVMSIKSSTEFPAGRERLGITRKFQFCLGILPKRS